MIRKEVLAKGLALIAVLFLLSASNAFSQTGICVGDLNCDGEVSGLDTIIYKADYPRSPYLNEPCPEYNPRCIPAPLPKTGQTTSYDPIRDGEDGDLEKGVAWPNPRLDTIFCTSIMPCINQAFDCDANSSNDVVIDNLTGLMWTRDANHAGENKIWQGALDYVDDMNIAGNVCGYTDWELPNLFELESLRDMSNYEPCLPTGHTFKNIQTSHYWSSTTYAGGTESAWVVDFYYGFLSAFTKPSYNSVWPVRGGQ